MKKVRFKALFALIMAVVLMVSSVPTFTVAAADDTYYPLTVSGFNIDVVADTTNYSALQSQGCLEGGHCYFSSAVRSNGYYPSGVIISTSSGKKFKMRASTENNSLQLTSGNRTGTLTLASPGVYSKLAVLVTGGGGQTNATATVIYTDGTESAATTITAYDWYSHHQSEVYASLYRMRIKVSGYMRGSIDSGSYSGMYEGVISGLDTTKEVSAVRFNWTSGNYFNAFAVSGVIGANEHIHDKLSFKQWTSTNSLPTEAGSYVLTSDVTISSTWNVPSGKVNLCLNGHGIKMTGSESVINVGSDSVFNLYECKTTSHKFSVNSDTSLATLDEANGSVTINGGYITGGNTNGSGGAMVINGTFNMYGGNIIGNKGGNGGAICTNANSTVHMYDGNICYNNTGGGGGAVFCGRPAELYISGGSIHHNKAGAWGGGIYMPEGATCVVDVSGGSFTDNITAKNGGAIHVSRGATLKLSGNPYIAGNKTTGNAANNINFAAGAFATIENSLDSSASIGVKSSSTTAVITSGLDANGSVSNFVSDNTDYEVYPNSDGEAVIGVFSHNHDDIDFAKWTSTNSLPTEPGNYCLLSNITISSVWNVPQGEVNLCLNGKGITRTNASDTTGSVINVGSGAKLNLYDCGTTERYYRITDPSANGAGLGTIISKADYDNLSDKERGTFTGGYITGGKAKDGGGVQVNGGSFIQYGGTIIGNAATGNDSRGGGVRVMGQNGSFTMEGGAILANKCDYYGGGIGLGRNSNGGYANEKSTMTINGGTLQYNWSGKNGGAIHVIGNNSMISAVITGGSIIDNYTVRQSAGSEWGGALIATFISPKISGNPIIKGNICQESPNDLCVTKGIDLSGHLDSDADVAVSLREPSKLSSGDILVGINANKDDIKYLHYSGANEATLVYCDGAKDWAYINDEFVELASTQHTHSSGTVWASTKANPVACVTVGDTTTAYSSFEAALSNWSEGSTLKLLKDATISTTINVTSGEHTLDLNGHGIRRTGTGCVIKVNEQSTLNLKDSDTSKEHKYKTASPAGNGAGVATVDDTLTSGYKTFKGGYITGGYITGGYNYGAGINVEGNGATLNMYGGTIIGNRLTAGSTGGGGVCLQDWDKSGGFNMYGGSIIGNTSNYGGGVYVRCGKTVIYDGEISNNVAHSNNIGGAVLAFGGNSTFIMEGGTINGNLAQHGGAIEASGDACVSIFGGTITNNTANGKGGALTNQRSDGDTSPAVFNISGAPVFSGNTAGGKSSDVYLCNTAVLNVTDEMTNTTPILVSRSNGSGTFTSGWKDKMGEADPAAYFTAEVSNYQVRRIRNGEAYVGLPHTHNWSYTANGDTITAKCSEYDSGLCALEPQTIKISAAGKVYDGTAVTATLTKSDGWKTDNGLTVPEIQYSGNTDAGTYTASITVGEKTASAEFTIDEASMADEVSGAGYTGDYDGEAHGITVTKPASATVKYGTESGTYDLSEAPKYTDAGTYTVYYQVTRKNYITVTDSATVTINKINAVVTITGHNGTADYDGEEHTVVGYDASTDSSLYDVTKDFTFSGTDEAKRTDAGLTNMGLKANQFKNTNPNFATVTFDITDGYIKVDPIDVTVTITGHILTVDYNDNAHSADGYDAEADSALYDVTKDFVYHGRAQAIRTDTGTTYMNLDSAKFENINPNFATVAFNVITDGYIEVIKVDAIITKTPQRKSNFVYNTSKQALVTAGTVWGGTLYYALGKDDKTAPADKQFTTEIPSAKEIGNYYVWYKVIADSNHYSLAPVCLKVTLADKDWVTVSGTVYNDKGEPQSGADVTLTSGNKTIDTLLSDAKGEYYFTVPAGVYNIVTSENGKSQTTKVELYQDKTQDVNMLNTKTESIVKVTSDNDFGVVVDGLNEEAMAIRKADKLSGEQSLSVLMTVEAKTIETANNSKAFKNLVKNTTFTFFDISLEKSVDSVKTALKTSNTVLEIAVPYEKVNRRDLAAYYCDGSEVKKFKESNTKQDGTFRIDKEKGIIYIYSKSFATFAIGYTPHYKVDSSISLGSFKGNVTIVVKGKNNEGTYTLKNVSVDKVDFDDIPKGEYEMTVTWVDGVENTLTVDVTVA